MNKRCEKGVNSKESTPRSFRSKVYKFSEPKEIFMVGSTGIEPATPTVSRRPRRNGQKPLKLRPSRKYVIPAGFSLVPGIEWNDGRATMFHVLCEDVNPGCEKSVRPRRAKGGR